MHDIFFVIWFVVAMRELWRAPRKLPSKPFCRQKFPKFAQTIIQLLNDMKVHSSIWLKLVEWKKLYALHLVRYVIIYPQHYKNAVRKKYFCFTTLILQCRQCHLLYIFNCSTCRQVPVLPNAATEEASCWRQLNSSKLFILTMLMLEIFFYSHRHYVTYFMLLLVFCMLVFQHNTDIDIIGK